MKKLNYLFILTVILLLSIISVGYAHYIISYDISSIDVNVSKINYTVKHYQMDLDGANYTLKDTETFSALKGMEVTPNVKTYNGFTSPSTQTVAIDQTGIIIEYKYTRNKYYLNLNTAVDDTYYSDGIDDFVFDVYVNGTKVADQTKDYYSQHYYESTYEIKNIKAKTNYIYLGTVNSSSTHITKRAVGEGDIPRSSSPLIGKVDQARSVNLMFIYLKNPDLLNSTNYINKRTLTGGDAFFGVKHYEYYQSTTKISDTSIITNPKTTSDVINFASSGNYYMYYRTVDNKGNKAPWIEEYVRVDIDKPEADFRVEKKGGKTYIVMDTFDALSDIREVKLKGGANATNRELPLKIWVAGVIGHDDTTNYTQFLKDFGYSNYHIEARYPTLQELKDGGYNTFVVNQHVWSVAGNVNEYFNNGIHLVTQGNDTTAAQIQIIKSNSGSTTAKASFVPAVENLFTRRLQDMRHTTTDSRQMIKFIDGTEVLYKEIRESDGAEFDSIGYYNKNGTKWLHSQMEMALGGKDYKNFFGASLHHISEKTIYYYEITGSGTYTFQIIDNAGNIYEDNYTYNM